jgi:hypothetical protein
VLFLWKSRPIALFPASVGSREWDSHQRLISLFSSSTFLDRTTRDLMDLIDESRPYRVLLGDDARIIDGHRAQLVKSRL